MDTYAPKKPKHKNKVSDKTTFHSPKKPTASPKTDTFPCVYAGLHKLNLQKIRILSQKKFLKICDLSHKILLQ